MSEDSKQEKEKERARIRDVLRQDARETGEELGSKIRATTRRPVYFLLVVLGTVIGLAANNVVRRVVDRMMGPPQVVELDDDLQVASEELRESADEIKTLVTQIESRVAANPDLEREFADLQARLGSLTALMAQTSAQTQKVAVISQALREDWQRNRQVVDRKIDSVPDLVLDSGDAVRVCNGLAAVGLLATDAGDGSAQIKVKDWTYRVQPAQRVPLEGGAAIDFIGLDGASARLKISCP